MPTLQQKYKELLARMRLPANREKYYALVGAMPADDKVSQMLRYKLNIKIPSLLKTISQKEGAERELCSNICRRELIKVEQLLDELSWTKAEE